MNSDETHRRAEALFKKEQRLREGEQAMAEHQTELLAMREKTARLRALRLTRDAANQKAPPANRGRVGRNTRAPSCLADSCFSPVPARAGSA